MPSDLGRVQVFDDPDARPHFVAADGQRHPIAPGHWTVGREFDSDLRLGDPTVGRRHAVLDATNASVTLTDLRSTNGTWVNDRRIRGGDLVPLHHGDVVRFGAAQLSFAAPALGRERDDTVVIGGVANAGPAPPTPVSGVPQMGIRQQSADQLNNVIGNQYNQFLQTVLEQRESFLREVAASRTRARRSIWFGLLLFVLGAGTYLWMIIRFISRAAEIGPGDDSAFNELWGEELGGVPIGLIGFAVAAVGVLMMILGIVLHVVATSRQRRMVAQPMLPIGGPGLPYQHE